MSLFKNIDFSCLVKSFAYQLYLNEDWLNSQNSFKVNFWDDEIDLL